MATSPVVDPSTRLRTLIASVEREMAATPPSAEVRTAFTALVDQMALGDEPEMRPCPACQAPCRVAASRCGFCWKDLPAVAAAATTAS
ncbi:MAG: hypothetical protein R3B06_26185 [Kofleriaceae bacterium]